MSVPAPISAPVVGETWTAVDGGATYVVTQVARCCMPTGEWRTQIELRRSADNGERYVMALDAFFAAFEP
jgi:hypothetical protein